MSRFFKYKRLDDLLGDARSQGLELTATTDLSPLTASRKIADRVVGNRLTIQPMEGCDGTVDGAPDDLTFRRYRRFGSGGAKMIWGEAAAVVADGRANTRQLLLIEKHAEGFEKMLGECRAAHRETLGDDSDLLIGLQLTHSGRYSVPKPLLAQHDPLLDPRTILDKSAGTVADADSPLLTDDDLLRLQDRYVEAASLALRIGFDFIDLKQCHRYLLNELLSSKTRPGHFGGSFENRTRFIREVVGRIRSENSRAIIATRLNLFDGLPFRKGGDGKGELSPFQIPVRSAWGTNEKNPIEPDLAEPIALIRELLPLGLSIVNASIGNPYASPHLLRPYEYSPVDGYETPEHTLVGVARHLKLTADVQTAFPDLAIVGSGYSWLQGFIFQVGAASVRDGRATFVGVGRASLSQPDFGRALLEGKPLDPKRTCRTFSYCTALMRSKHNDLGQFASGCPPFDKETYGPIWKEANLGITSKESKEPEEIET